eukprot:NODE_106_length_19857_cov_0.799980.p5 type:complete len:420 gc:universal NODE_106_length_19857_cov_0.799980:10788-9529(-)
MTMGKAEPYNSKTGFIEPVPLIKRPSHLLWETIISDMPILLKGHTFRDVIDEMQVLKVDLFSLPELKRAYVILTMFTNGYLWGYHVDDYVNHSIPASISIPLLQTCKVLRMMPICGYASVCIWNVKARADNIYDLDTMESVNTFTNSVDESHFYLVSCAIDAYGANTIPKIESLVDNKIPLHEIVPLLKSINEDIQMFSKILMRMTEKCDPSIFYQQVRHYMNGSLKVEGCMFKGVFEIDEHWKNACELRDEGLFFRCHGGSAAQSPIIHLVDIFLGVKHHPTSKSGVNFIPLMREYMYGLHRDYLNGMISKCRIFREKIKELGLENVFNLLIDSIKIMRDFHFQIVARYIISQSNKKEPLGTGGMKMVKFLKQARDETKDAKLESENKSLCSYIKLSFKFVIHRDKVMIIKMQVLRAI